MHRLQLSANSYMEKKEEYEVLSQVYHPLSRDRCKPLFSHKFPSNHDMGKSLFPRVMMMIHVFVSSDCNFGASIGIYAVFEFA